MIYERASGRTDGLTDARREIKCKIDSEVPLELECPGFSQSGFGLILRLEKREDRLQKWGEIEMCAGDWRWPRLIVPWRCALLLFLSKMGEIKGRERGGRRRKGGGRRRERDRQQRSEKNVPYRAYAGARLPTGSCETKENIDHWWVSAVAALIRKSVRAHQWYLTVESAHAAGQETLRGRQSQKIQKKCFQNTTTTAGSSYYDADAGESICFYNRLITWPTNSAVSFSSTEHVASFSSLFRFLFHRLPRIWQLFRQ